MTPRSLRAPLAAALAMAAAAGAATASELPNDARIVYDVLYGSNQIRIGRAEQRWHVEGGQYELQTELIPLVGPRVRYVSRGQMGPKGLVPETFAEFRGRDSQPRVSASFDWPSHQVSYGRGDERKRAPLEAGAQDVNALSYQLAWLGDSATTRVQVATGKKVAHYRFTRGAATRVTVNGQEMSAWPLRSIEGQDRTEVWVAPQLGNLPVRVTRLDDDKELRFVARDVQSGAPRTP